MVFVNGVERMGSFKVTFDIQYMLYL
jgi:hypothetical protein